MVIIEWVFCPNMLKEAERQLQAIFRTGGFRYFPPELASDMIKETNDRRRREFWSRKRFFVPGKYEYVPDEIAEQLTPTKGD